MRSFFKQTAETKTVSIDFTPVLATGETINSSNVSVTAVDVQTSTDTTSTVIVTGSTGVGGTGSTIVSFRITSGAEGKIYKVTCSTGTTNNANVHEEDILVIVSSDVNLLFSIDEIKENLGITDNSKDALLFGLVREANDWVSNACGRDFSFKQYTETFYPDERGDTIILDNFPLDSVQYVVVDGLTLDEETDGNKNWIYKQHGSIQRIDGGLFTKSPYPTKVSYKAGFTVIPEDVRLVVKKIVIYEYQRRLREGILAENIGDYRIVYNRLSLIDDAMIRMVINRYKKRMF